MMTAHEREKTVGSAMLRTKVSSLERLEGAEEEEEEEEEEEDHSSRTTRSRARVTAKRVRSNVRPAWWMVLASTPGGNSDRTGMVSVYAWLSRDWRTWRLSAAAKNVESNLASLLR